MTAVEWLYKNLLENPISNQDIEYNEAVFHNAKEMEKQQGYSEEEVIDIAKQAFVLGKDFGLIGTFKEWFDTVKKK
jgi:hypothetical protein